MKEQIGVDKSLKDPTDKIKQALEKAIFVKNKIYINADSHTFQPHMIEIINLLSDAKNICMDNIIADPYQRIEQIGTIRKSEHERLKRLDENVKEMKITNANQLKLSEQKLKDCKHDFYCYCKINHHADAFVKHILKSLDK